MWNEPHPLYGWNLERNEMKGEDMGADKEWFEIIMKQGNGNLMTVLENQIQSDIGGTREQANRVANHILDILDNVKENKDQEIRNKAIDEFAEAMKYEIREGNWRFSRLDFEDIDEIAGQLKGVQE